MPDTDARPPVTLTHPDFPGRSVTVPAKMAEHREAAGWKAESKPSNPSPNPSPKPSTAKRVRSK